MASRIEQIIEEIEEYIDGCKPQTFSSSKIIVNREEMEELLNELRIKTPEEIKRYQKIISNKEAILADAQAKADAIIAQAQVKTDELVSEHQIMQQAYAQANEVVMIATKQAQEILDNATNDANNIRMGAMQYTDDILRNLETVSYTHLIKEGERLRADLVEKLDGMISYVDYIEERSPQILEEYRMRLESKVQELLGDRQLDDARIAAEITIFADKICVDEETVRLRSHILSMKETLLAGGGMGRKLDFIAQEMNREANTILSKTTDLKVSDVGINLKTDIEKVREQIQNIE